MRSLRFLLWTTFQLHVLGYFFDTINSTDQKPRLDAAERNIDCAQEHQAILAMPSPLLPGFYSMCTSLLQPTTSTIYQTQTISQTFATSVTYDYLVTWPYGESVSTTLVTSSVIITATPSSSITQTAEVFTSYVPTAQAASTTSHSGPKGKGVKRAPVIPTALAPPKQRWGNFASALAEASDATKACSCFLGPSQSVTSTVYTTVVSSSIELDTSISITAVPATTSTKIDVATMVSTTTAAPAVQTLQAIRTYWLVAETIGAAYSYAGVGGTERGVNLTSPAFGDGSTKYLPGRQYCAAFCDTPPICVAWSLLVSANGGWAVCRAGPGSILPVRMDSTWGYGTSYEIVA